jgi:hypothetical protein
MRDPARGDVDARAALEGRPLPAPLRTVRVTSDNVAS